MSKEEQSEPTSQDKADTAPLGSTLRSRLVGHAQQVSGASWSPDGRLLASASGDGAARLWEVVSGRTLLTLEGHAGPVLSVSWSPDGLLLASSSEDRTIRLWEASSGRLLWTIEGHADE